MSTQEEVGEKSLGWFDVLNTPLNACSLETYFPVPRDDGISGNSDIPSDIPLVVGCYQLNESSQVIREADTASSSVGSSRCGELRLHMIPAPSTSKTEMQFGDAACVLQMESGVLDGKWKRRRKTKENNRKETPLFASACASGNIHIHSLEKNTSTESTDTTTLWSLNHFTSTDVQSDAGLCLALAWNDYLNESEDQIVSSYSKGEVAIHQISYCGDTNEAPMLEETHRWNAHTLFGCPSEVWTCSFLRGVENVVLSGADDVSIFTIFMFVSHELKKE